MFSIILKVLLIFHQIQINMENTYDLKRIKNFFDNFVDEQMQKKQRQESQPSIQQNNINKIDKYLDYLEDRIKIRTPQTGQRFQKMIKPMKKLKTFIPIHKFIQQLQRSEVEDIQSNNFIAIGSKTSQLRSQYQHKVQKHLRTRSIKRQMDQRAGNLLINLENQFQAKDQDSKWIFHILDNIKCTEKPNKVVEADKQQQQTQYQSNIFAETFDHQKKTESFNSKKQKYHKNSINFKRISTVLSNRLKTILTNKYSNNKTMRSSNFLTKKRHHYQSQIGKQNLDPNIPNLRKKLILEKHTVLSQKEKQKKQIMFKDFQQKMSKIFIMADNQYQNNNKMIKRSGRKLKREWSQI